MKKFIVLLFIIPLVSCGQKKEFKTSAEAKQTILTFLQYIKDDNYDSVKIIYPVDELIYTEDHLKTNEYFRAKYEQIKEIIQSDGIPSIASLISTPCIKANELYRIKFISKHINEVGLDSIVFSFNKGFYVNRISYIEQYRQPQKLKIISPIPPAPRSL